MPSPFSKKPKSDESAKSPGVTTVTNSRLVCEVCWDEVSDGLYYPQEKRLEFRCKHGHVNVVKGLEI